MTLHSLFIWFLCKQSFEQNGIPLKIFNIPCSGVQDTVKSVKPWSLSHRMVYLSDSIPQQGGINPFLGRLKKFSYHILSPFPSQETNASHQIPSEGVFDRSACFLGSFYE